MYTGMQGCSYSLLPKYVLLYNGNVVEPSRAKIYNCSQLRVCESVIKMSHMWLYMSYTLILQFLIIGCSFCYGRF